MVKGITRQVILVKSPDPKLFEEAIFIVKEEALAREGVSADQVLRQARQAADGYLKGSRAWDRRLGRFAGLAGPFWGGGGPAGLRRLVRLAVFIKNKRQETMQKAGAFTEAPALSYPFFSGIHRIFSYFYGRTEKNVI